MSTLTRALIACTMLLAAAWGCSDKAKSNAQTGPSRSGRCKPPPVEIFMQAAEKLNLNATGQSMPVEVRVLLLKERELFDQLDFEAVWKDDGKALGKDLVKSASLTVFPGKLKIFPMKSTPAVAYVALVGIFRRPQGQRWKHVVDVRAQNQKCSTREDLHTIVHAQLHGSSITRPRTTPASRP